ncbi:MAG TPA: hypothetical protein VGJ93_16015 [Desulfuromonadaceae bacterium]|jgi:hypothetical protein
MKKMSLGIFLLLLILAAVTPSQAAFVVGGANGWQLSTDGMVNVFSTYVSTSPAPQNVGLNLLGGGNGYTQAFAVRTGLLPSVVAFNIKAPTTNGVESNVRIGIYPQIQNSGDSRFDTKPNIDFREIFYTAKGTYGELLAGRALNLYQGKNILTDMTLVTAGVVGAPGGGTTLGHIGYGYLYTNFGAQLRYTTPDMGGAKLAVSVNDPYAISASTDRRNVPRIESELSYGTSFNGGNLQTWISGMYQRVTRSDAAVVRPGKQNESIGGAGGVEVGYGAADFLVSGYGGKGLGMVSVQDGDTFGAGATSVDAAGSERRHWGFLTQATYKLTPVVKVGVNYGQSRQEETDYDAGNRGTIAQIKKQEAAVGVVTYNLNEFIQFIAEYTYAQNTWHNDAKQHSNMFALGTILHW